jgi:tetratricopeptide (TPR) repeat protein
VFHLEGADLDDKANAALLRAQIRVGDLDAAQRRAELVRRMDKVDKELAAVAKALAPLFERRDKLLVDWDSPEDQQDAARRVINRSLCAERGLGERWPREQVERLVNEAAQEGLEHGLLFSLRAWLHLEKGQLRKAIADADAAIKLLRTDMRAHLTRGRARLEQGNVNGALSDLRKATEYSKREDPMVLHWLAAALLEAGRTKEAIETQRLALLLRPDDVELQQQLRRMEMKSKETTGGRD